MDRTGFVPLAGLGQAWGCGSPGNSVRHQNPGPGSCSAVYLQSLPVSGPQLLVISEGPSSSPALEFSDFGKVRAEAESCPKATTIGSNQEGSSAEGGRKVGTTCRYLCAREDLISVGKVEVRWFLRRGMM